MNQSAPSATSANASTTQKRHLRTGRSVLLIAMGAVLIGCALWIRSSSWLREFIVRSKDPAELERLVSDSPKDPIARYYLAKNYYLMRRFGDAAREYQEVLNIDSRSARAELGLGLSLLEVGDYSGARLSLERVLTLDPRSAWAEYLLGKFAWQAGDVDGAMKRTKRAVELDPRSDQAWYGLAACYTQKRQYKDAINALREAVSRNARNAKALTGLGELLIYRGEGDEGRKHLERALEIDPDFPAACLLLGQFLGNNPTSVRDQDKSEELLKRAIKLKGPRLFDAHLDLGRLLIRKNQLSDAVQSFEEAKRLVPSDERSYRALADAYRRLGKKSDAEKEDRQFASMSAKHVRMEQLEARTAHDPGDLAASLELARLYVSLSMPMKAAYRYQAYLSARPDDKAAAAEFQRVKAESAGASTASQDFSIAAPRE